MINYKINAATSKRRGDMRYKISFTKEIQQLTPQQLTWKPSPEKWSIAEVD